MYIWSLTRDFEDFFPHFLRTFCTAHVDLQLIFLQPVTTVESPKRHMKLQSCYKSVNETAGGVPKTKEENVQLQDTCGGTEQYIVTGCCFPCLSCFGAGVCFFSCCPPPSCFSFSDFSLDFILGVVVSIGTSCHIVPRGAGIIAPGGIHIVSPWWPP